MTRTVSLLCLLLSCGAPSLAQEAPEPSPQARTQAFLDGLTGCDEALLGRTHYGLHVNGPQNVGQLVLDVARAPEGSGAVYEVTLSMKSAMGLKNETVLLLDEKLGLVSSRTTKDEKGVASTSTVKRVGDEWIQEETRGEEVSTRRLPVTGVEHGDMAAAMLLVRKLDLAQGGSYEFSGARWKTSEQIAIKVKVGPLETITHRGAQVEAYELLALRPGDDTLFWVDKEKNLLQMGPKGPPVKMVLGTAEEVTRNLAPAEGAEPGPKPQTPKDAVLDYFRVLAKELPISRLDDIMDWEALRAEMVAERPGSEAIDVAGFAGLMKNSFAKQPKAVSAEQIEAIGSLLESQVEGDRAEAWVSPRRADKFTLRKSEGGWLITHFPH